MPRSLQAALLLALCILTLSCASEPDRVIAIADTHGDLAATLEALQIAGAIDEHARWIGEDLTVIQLGDQLDRGDGEQAILDLFERLEREAEAAGGEFIALNGNHEIMNVELDLRYITPGGFDDFAEFAPAGAPDSLLATYPELHRGRVAAFRPGGPYALKMADRPTILHRGDNLFVHGGVLPEHVAYGIDRINEEYSAWMRGDGAKPAMMHTRRSPEWARNFSDDPDDCDCDTLSMVLDAVGAKRMIVGHTVQTAGIASYCDGRVWCLDTGMSAHYGGRPQVLEVIGDALRVLPPQDLPIRAQRDTVGFAVTGDDFAAVLAASRTDRDDDAWTAAIMPHDDYLYAGRTAATLLPGLKAKTWIVVGVCHACRRLDLRDRVLMDDFESWRIAGHDMPVNVELRAALRERLPDDVFRVNRERHAAEHSIEALLPWLRAARPDFDFVPLLIAGTEAPELRESAGALATALADICRERGWRPGRDIGILISADAVHYGCDGWGDRPYAPFGCEARGHARARGQDIDLIRDTLVDRVTDDRVDAFIDRVWDRAHPDYPDYPYKITWCGLYSIPFGLTLAQRLHAETGLGIPEGELLRYGDSHGDGRLDAAVEHLGLTAPAALGHWVGYPAIGYREGDR